MAKKHCFILVTFGTILTFAEFKRTLKMTEVRDSAHHHCERGPVDDQQERQCGGYAYRCNNTGLTNVPHRFPRSNSSSKMCVLDLSQNKIEQIDNNSFSEVSDIIWLLLSHNKLIFIDSGAFVNLTKLRYINLTSNSLNIQFSFGEDVFKPLVSLQYVNLKVNHIKSYAGLQKLLQPLKRLHSLFISGCYNCTFEAGFENFTNLRRLSLSGTEYNSCNIDVLLNHTFYYLPQITEIQLSSCNINEVEVLAFTPLKNIQKVDISYNENLHFIGMKNVLVGLVNSSVARLEFDRIYEFYDRGTDLKKKYIEPIKYLKNLRSLRLDLNKIEVIDDEVFDLIPDTLTHIVLSGNRLTWGSYVNSLLKLKHVVYLDISRQHLNYDPFLREHYEHLAYLTALVHNEASSEAMVNAVTETRSDSRNQVVLSESCQTCLQSCRQYNLECVCIPPKLVHLNWKMSFLRFQVRNFKICPPSSLKILDVSFNLILEWTGPVLGLENLIELNLAENYCKNMSLGFFANLNSLRKLNVSSNFLGPILNPSNDNAGNVFKQLKNLETIDLTETRLTALPADIFENLKVLKHLNVSRNMLTRWNCSMKTNCLRFVGMSDNKIQTLPQTFREYLDRLNDLNQNESCGRKHPVHLDLSNNPIQCDCKSRPFLEWLSATFVSVKFAETDECYSDGYRVMLGDKDDIKAFIKHLDIVCFPFVSVIVSACICIMSSVVTFFLYRHRWKLRHLYYSKGKRHHHYGYDRLFERDAFVSYAKSEANFIKNKLVPTLERDPNALTLWVADRDSLAGASIASNITHAINNCKKSVLILSKNYFRESWCNYEMNMARIESIESNRKLMIIVLYNDVSVKDIPLDYLRLLKSERSLEYPSHPQDINTFWTILDEAIRTDL